MMCSGLLTGIFLLSLFSPVVCTAVGNLWDVIKFLRNTYGTSSQFALAINVPTQKCSAGFIPDQNFLPNDDAQTVKNNMNGQNKVYKGQDLIGAKPKPITGTQANYHSEYLLLIRSNPPNLSPDDPLMKSLLDHNKQGCVIFYTYNSPCVQTCSTPNSPYSIIPALNIFRNHGGPKAFVFTQVWHRDINSTYWKDNVKLVNDRVPVYKCDNISCTPCVNNNGVVNNRCTN